LADIGCDIPSLRDRAPCQLKTHLFALNLLFFSTLTLRLTRMGGGRDLLDEEVDAGGVVLHRKGGFENVAVAVTDQCDVFALGIVEGDA
jgi:hypothetical protein